MLRVTPVTLILLWATAFLWPGKLMQTKHDIMSEKILSLVNERARVRNPGLSVDVIADLVCPWSYLGLQRLERALDSVQGPASCTWYAFQLNPEMPVEGMGFDEYLEKKFGDRAALEPALVHISEMAATEGIQLNFDRIERIPNTVNAHCLVRQAAGAGQASLVRSLYRSFFEFGEDLGSRELLEAVALREGMSSRLISQAFDNEALRKSVLAEEAKARRAGISGVPNFLMNRRVFVVGAQDTDQLLSRD